MVDKVSEVVNNFENVRYLPNSRKLKYMVVECVRYFDMAQAGVLYGLKAMSGENCVFSMEDISPDRNMVERLATLCNMHYVLPCHVQDLLDDLRVSRDFEKSI